MIRTIVDTGRGRHPVHHVVIRLALVTVFFFLSVVVVFVFSMHAIVLRVLLAVVEAVFLVCLIGICGLVPGLSQAQFLRMPLFPDMANFSCLM